MKPQASRIVFPTSLGWFAIEFGSEQLRKLVFGHSNRANAVAALSGPTDVRFSPANHPLVERLKRYAEGLPDDFLDVDVAYAPQTQFAQRVLRECRRIRVGETISYRDLASRAGRPAAARAVGQVMASNLMPIIIPCHRVIGSGGRLGGYSAPGGLATKQQLLALEAESCLVAL